MQFANTLMTYVLSHILPEREEGQTLVEYALIISLVSIALVVSLGFLAGGIDEVFDTILTELGITSPGNVD